MGSFRSHLANTIFCWLPPENCLKICSGRGGRTSYFATSSVATAFSLRASTPKIAFVTFCIAGSVMFSRAVKSRIAPYLPRSPGTKAMPRRIDSAGSRFG